MTPPPRRLLVERAADDRPPFSAPTGALAGLLVALASTPALAQAERWEDLVPSAAPGAPFVTRFSGGRWQVRCAPAGISAPVRAEWFGAAPNDQNDDRVAIQTAIDCFNRVDLQAGTYLIQRGLAATYIDKHGVRQSLAWYRGVVVKTGTSITGAGQTATTVKLANGQTFNFSNGDLGGQQFSVIGSLSSAVSASNVQVRGLTIDCNFDGQVMNTSTTPSIAAIDVTGPNLLAEHLKVINYGSNGKKENFVIYSQLAFKDVTADRTCATVRYVELTNPGHNMPLKRQVGFQAYFAEITHITVGGAQNYDNSPNSDARWLSHRGIKNAEGHNTTSLSSMATMLGFPVGPGQYVEIQYPEPQVFVWRADSDLPADDVRVFEPPVPQFVVRAPGPNGIRRGRFIRTSEYGASAGATQYQTSSEDTLFTTFPNPWALPDRARVLVLAPRPAAFFRLGAETPPPLSTYKGVEHLEKFPLWHRLGTGKTTGCNAYASCTPQRCSGASCDPSYDPSFMGENETNRWPCFGGEISNVNLHDVRGNPDGRNSWGVGGAISEDDARTTNASFVNGISAFESEGLVIKNNTITNFDGVALFHMSWWNKNLTVDGNTFTNVEYGIQLSGINYRHWSAYSTRYALGCAAQAPRLMGAQISNNRIVTSSNFVNAGRNRGRAAIQIDPRHVEMDAGYSCPGGPPDDAAPRFSDLTVRNNHITGERFEHFVSRVWGDPSTDYRRHDNPVGLFVNGIGRIRNLRYTANTSCLEFSKTGTWGQLLLTAQAIAWYPSDAASFTYPYTTRKPQGATPSQARHFPVVIDATNRSYNQYCNDSHSSVLPQLIPGDWVSPHTFGQLSP